METAFYLYTIFVVLCLPVDEFRQWLFYTLRQVFLLCCLAFGAYRYCTARNEVEKARLHCQDLLFFVTSALCLASSSKISAGSLSSMPASSPMPIICLSISASGISLKTSCFWPSHKTAGQKHKKHPRFQVEIGGISFNLFPHISGGFALLPYAATLCGAQRTENRRFKIAFRLLPLFHARLSWRHSDWI